MLVNLRILGMARHLEGMFFKLHGPREPESNHPFLCVSIATFFIYCYILVSDISCNLLKKYLLP